MRNFYDTEFGSDARFASFRRGPRSLAPVKAAQAGVRYPVGTRLAAMAIVSSSPAPGNIRRADNIGHDHASHKTIVAKKSFFGIESGLQVLGLWAAETGQLLTQFKQLQFSSTTIMKSNGCGCEFVTEPWRTFHTTQ